MNKEERKAIEDMNRFANGIDMSCVTARQMQIILNLIKKLQKENEDYFEKYRYHLQQNESLTKEFSNVIPVQIVKDKIEKEIKYHEKNILDIENTTMLKGKTAKEETEIEFNKYAIVVLKKMLQNLKKI